MSSFNPNIPQATDKLSASQPQLLTNNQGLDAIFGIDHFPFSNGTPSKGFHQQVTLPIASSPTVPDTQILRMFTKMLTSLNQPFLYGLRNGDDPSKPIPIQPISNLNVNLSSQGTGYVQMSNLLIKWGVSLATYTSTNGSATLTFDNTVPFSVAPYVCFTSLLMTATGGDPATLVYNSLTTTTVNLIWNSNTTASRNLAYLVIGQAGAS